MAQYRDGSVDVVGGSPIVTGVGTLWQTDPIQPIAVNNLFIVNVADEDVLYTIASVDSDTQITLSIPFAGTTANGLTYAIVRDFTPNGIPLMNVGDLFLPQIYNRAIADLESSINTTPFTLPVTDTQPLVADDVDPTKLVRIDTGDVPGATTRAIFMPNSDIDFRAPAPVVRRLQQEPIEGNALSGIANVFDGDPDSPDCMLGELLQCDNGTANFNIEFDPTTIASPAGWNGLLCWVRPTSNANLFSISVPVAGQFSWNNGYPSPDQNVTTLYFGLSPSFVVGNVLPILKRGSKIIVQGPVRAGASEDLVFRFGTADANAQGGIIRNYANEKDVEGDGYTFTVDDAGGVKEYAGGTVATWTIPNLTVPAGASLSVVVHNTGSGNLTLSPSGVTLVGGNVLAPDKTCSISWLGGARVKTTGELS